MERQLLQEQKARILQDGILASHLHKQKELKLAQEKISSQVFSLVAFKSLYMYLYVYMGLKKQVQGS